ncbi:MAG: rRNA pseudouridine synthase [Verrucomicrobiaceae bacterium]|nr:rRNA pseudouridine synthase [Verrucomicrobiaceae bacterium]
MRRLDQLLAAVGWGSRRDARELVNSGRVTVDGVTADDPGKKVKPTSVAVDGALLEAPDGLFVIFHKPVGYVCTHSTDEGPTIYELLPSRWLLRNPPISSVGRLDKDTSGLLLITDQGDLLHRLTSPKAVVEKTYEVETDSPIPASLVEVFADGTLMLRGESKPCLPAKLATTSDRTASLVITEGRYHQVRRMFASQGLNVVRLHRSRFGEYDLTDLTEGSWRLLPLPG